MLHMTEKKKPERMCIACRKRGGKDTLLRVVKDKTGVVNIDPTGKAAGRGAYVCADEACIALAEKKHCLSRALRQQVDDGIYERLRRAVGNGAEYDG